MLFQRHADKLIMKIGPLPDALDPGFHSVPAGPAHPDRDADGAGVT
jgi:hypothetical protein